MSPKGSNMIAQGNALGGQGHKIEKALKGRHKETADRKLLRPFRAGWVNST